MPAIPRTSVSGVSADNIIEGSRKRARLEADASTGLNDSPASSTSRLPDSNAASAGPGAEEATHLGFKLLDVLINRIDEDDSPLTVPFLALPSRSDYPDYYELIKNPISLEQIRRRLQKRQFSSLEQVRNAFETVCRNAKRYNLKGSEIYEKSRMMHQIVLHVYIDLVEKGEVQPAGDIVLRSVPTLEQQSARLAEVEKPSRRARLDYDELDGRDVSGRVSLRLKKEDDIDYEEDNEEEEEGGPFEEQRASGETQVKKGTPVRQMQSTESKIKAKVERSTPQIQAASEADDGDEMEGDLSSAPATYEGDIDMQDPRGLDRSMLTLSGKFDRRKRPGPRGKRLKSTLRHLVGELKIALDQSGQPITRFFLALPSRLQYPDYYKVIQRPIALDSIEDKVVNKDYVNPYALIRDLRQMVENAQYYNEEGSEVWEAAEEVRQYVENTTIPTLLADGFTLDPNDVRQSALPVEIAANSTIPSQVAAFRIQAERRAALENGTSTEMVESVSPELPARSLPQGNEGKLKVRLSTRGNTSTSPAPLADLQPPIPAPSSGGLGLSVNEASQDHSSMSGPQSPFGTAPSGTGMATSAGTYASPSSSIPATPSSYLNASQGHPSPMGVVPWSTAPANGTPNASSGNSYFTSYASSMPGRVPSSSSMAPPAGYLGSPGPLPFQKPTSIQMRQQQGAVDANAAALTLPPNGAIARTSPQLSKRLPGEAPPFDALLTNSLQVDAETSIVREAVISHFVVQVQGKEEEGRKKMVYRLRNDVTRVHSLSILSDVPNRLDFQVEMTPRSLVAKEAGEQEEGAEERRWTVSIHHNGKGVRPTWQGEQGSAETAKEDTTASTTNTTTSSRVQVPAGSLCRFAFTPQSGANIVTVHLYPPPPNSALQEIAKEEKHPLRSKAKALLDLPERYRLLIYCKI